MPMTVCLLVAARYVPQLKFLTILLADSPPLTPAERVYQRLLAFDYNEPLKLARQQLKEIPLVTYYDDVLLPALVMAEQDRYADLLNDDQASFALEATEDLIEDLSHAAFRGQDVKLADVADRDNAAEGSTEPPQPTARVLCIPLRDDADEMAAKMLVQLLTAEGFPAISGTIESLTSEVVEQVAESESDIVVISVVPPIAPRDSRLLWRRLRHRYPHLPIVVGFWTAENDKQSLAEPVEDSASRIVTTLAGALVVIRSLAALPKSISKTG
jgi:methylmalonyl-CoA mutase cobalamin-binding subunit